MKEIIHEGILLDETGKITFHQLCEICASDEKVLIEMVEFGILEPKGEDKERWIFARNAIERSQKALRLHRDLAINWAGISLALDLLEEIENLRQRLKILKD